MPFKYKIRRIPRKPPAFGSITRANDDEVLSGYIYGADASDIEERFARALDKDSRVTGYSFREPVITARNLPGQLEVDFVVQVGPEIQPYQIDGEYAHKGASKKQDDARKDAMVNAYYEQYGARLIKRIDGELLRNQDEADKLVRSLL
jgi:hypothetical protein